LRGKREQVDQQTDEEEAAGKNIQDPQTNLSQVELVDSQESKKKSEQIGDPRLLFFHAARLIDSEAQCQFILAL
jgi:hypothetical protein